MKLKSLLFTAILFSSPLFVAHISAIEPSKSVQEFNSGEGLLPEDSATFPELRTWALYQFFELEVDSPAFGIQDYMCRMIPETGLKFLLEKDPNRLNRAYLYLDLTKYKPQERAKFVPRKLVIYVNGRLKKEIYTDKKKNFKNPVEVILDPYEFPDHRIYVELIPSQNEIGRFWGVWDAFVLESPMKVN